MCQINIIGVMHIAFLTGCSLFIQAKYIEGFLFFPRGGSAGYLAAVATPLDLPNRNVYVSFNFEANYGLPDNETLDDWVQRWNYTDQPIGIGNDVTPITSRNVKRSGIKYTRATFYHSIINYFNYMELNGTNCLLRIICEISDSRFDETSGLIGSLIKILFMPTTSAPELELESSAHIYDAEFYGRQSQCDQYAKLCPYDFLNMLSVFV